MEFKLLKKKMKLEFHSFIKRNGTLRFVAVKFGLY